MRKGNDTRRLKVLPVCLFFCFFLFVSLFLLEGLHNSFNITMGNAQVKDDLKKALNKADFRDKVEQCTRVDRWPERVPLTSIPLCASRTLRFRGALLIIVILFPSFLVFFPLGQGAEEGAAGQGVPGELGCDKWSAGKENLAVDCGG